MIQPLLQVENLSKQFPGVKALDDVTFEVRPHEVVGLIGENGAGKSTLLKILSGVYTPDSGTIKMLGEKVRFSGPAASARAGIGMVHQEQSLINEVTIGENVMLGAEGDSIRGGIYRWKHLHAKAQKQLDKLGLSLDSRTQLASLSFAQKQMVELAKALSVEEACPGEPVIVLDEPTSVLESADLETLYAQIDRLRKIASVVFVSHRLDEVLRVSDRVYVMKDGKVVAERDPRHVTTDELHSLMVGRGSSNEFYRESDQLDLTGRPPVLEASNLSLRGRFSDVSLSVQPGEVLGIAGVQGSGREELTRVIFGAEQHHAGELTLDGRAVRFSSPVAAVRAGIGYIPAERKIEGIAQGMSVEENILLADPAPVSAGPFLKPGAGRKTADDWISRLRIKTPGPAADVANLSGGNQQKVALAKWLNSPRLKVLILDHPTRGLDVGAKEDVYTLVRELCAKGIAVILLGDTLDEIIALSHRIAVMKDGRISAWFDAPRGNKPAPVDLVEWMV